MFDKYRLVLMFVVILAGFILLVIVYMMNPSRRMQGESLCSKFSSFYKRGIENGKIELIKNVPSDHGAIEFFIVELDTIYSFRIYEPIYEEVSLSGKSFQKKENSLELMFANGSNYKIIRTCDEFF